MSLRNLFGNGQGTNPAHHERVEQVTEEVSRGRAGAQAARQTRTIGSRGTHTRVGSSQARVVGTNLTRGHAPADTLTRDTPR